MNIEDKPEYNFKPIKRQSNIVNAPGGSVMGGGSVSSTNFVTGVSGSGWNLDATGNIEANDGTFRGTLETDSIFFKRQFIYTCFESLDGWETDVVGTGAVTVNLGSLYLKTGATNNSSILVANRNLSVLPLKIGEKSSLVEYGLVIPILTGDNYTAYFGVGDLNGALGGDGESYGFKVVNDTLYALYSVVAGETLTEITGVTLSDFNVYRTVYDFSKKLLSFYVNGILKTTISTAYPVVSIEGRFVMSIKCTDSVNREMYVAYATFAQDL